jgi:hypothetical protein
MKVTRWAEMRPRFWKLKITATVWHIRNRPYGWCVNKANRPNPVWKILPVDSHNQQKCCQLTGKVCMIWLFVGTYAIFILGFNLRSTDSASSRQVVDNMKTLIFVPSGVSEFGEFISHFLSCLSFSLHTCFHRFCCKIFPLSCVDKIWYGVHLWM